MKKAIAALLLLVLASGCATLRTYTPGESGITTSKAMYDLVTFAEPYQGYIVVGNFDATHLYKVDVANNMDVTIDCTEFGYYLKKNTREGLQNANIFQKASFRPPTASGPYLKLTGKVEELTIVNNHGASATATGRITANLTLMPDNRTIETYHIKETGISEGALLFSASLDPLGVKLSKTLVEKIAASSDVAQLLHDTPDLRLALGGSKPSASTAATATVIPVKPVNSKRPATTANFGTYHALVIGNDSYPDLPSLQTARSDAKTVAGILENKYGFQVKLMLDATRSDILTALGRYRKKMSATDNLLVYYAGHGWLDEDADMGYWLPVDATRDSQVNWISNNSVTASVRAIRAKHVMIVSDSCYSGKIARGIHIKQPSSDYLNRISKKKARVVLSSGGLEPVMDSGGQDNHSVFASAFISALNANPSTMDGTTLFTEVREQVGWNADQTPEYANIHKAGHAGGDFIFVRQK